MGSCLRIPTAVRLGVGYIAGRLEEAGTRSVKPHRGHIGEVFRIDAKAEGPDIMVLGGWRTLGASSTREARWVSHRIERAEAPWALLKELQRITTTLELLAVLFAVVLLVDMEDRATFTTGTVGFMAVTDNQSNSGVI